MQWNMVSHYYIMLFHTQRDQMEERGLELRIWDLPEKCISHIFSLTSPHDACRCSVVSSKFRMAAESDAAWERFLPSNWEDTISRSVSPVEFSSLKALYFHLCDSPILLDQGKRSFALEKISGKISYMLGPEDLWIQWHCVPLVWDGNYPMPYAFPYHKPIKSRFSEICHINDIDRLQLRGRIQMKLLCPNTTYAAYLVYVPRFAGIEHPPLKVWVGFVGEGVESEVDEVGTNAYLLTTIFTPEDDGYRYRYRSDEWMEIKMGEFFTGQDDVHEVEMRLWEIGEYDVFQASGLDVQGIEIRPKRGQNELKKKKPEKKEEFSCEFGWCYASPCITVEDLEVMHYFWWVVLQMLMSLLVIVLSFEIICISCIKRIRLVKCYNSHIENKINK